MAKVRFQFTLPQVAASTVWLATVFAAAHYALRLPLDLSLKPFFIVAVGSLSFSAMMLGYMWIYQRKALRDGLKLRHLRLTIANVLLLICGAGMTASIAIMALVLDADWVVSLPLLALSAMFAAPVLLAPSSYLVAGRRRRRQRIARARLAELLIEGRALLDEQLLDEAAFVDWQQQVAAWRTECERSLATWLTPRELAEIFAPSDTASIWIHRVHHEHEQALGNLEAWLDRLRLLHSSSRWP